MTELIEVSYSKAHSYKHTEVRPCPVCGESRRIMPNVFGAPLECGFQDYVSKHGQVFKHDCRKQL